MVSSDVANGAKQAMQHTMLLHVAINTVTVLDRALRNWMTYVWHSHIVATDSTAPRAPRTFALRASRSDTQ